MLQGKKMVIPATPTSLPVDPADDAISVQLARLRQYLNEQGQQYTLIQDSGIAVIIKKQPPEQPEALFTFAAADFDSVRNIVVSFMLEGNDNRAGRTVQTWAQILTRDRPDLQALVGGRTTPKKYANNDTITVPATDMDSTEKASADLFGVVQSQETSSPAGGGGGGSLLALIHNAEVSSSEPAPVVESEGTRSPAAGGGGGSLLPLIHTASTRAATLLEQPKKAAHAWTLPPVPGT